MTRDDIIRMAYKVSDGVLSYDAEGRWILSEQEVIQLAALVAAAEREACAELADKCIEDSYRVKPQNKEEANDLKVIRILSEEFAIAIRARGKT